MERLGVTFDLVHSCVQVAVKRTPFTTALDNEIIDDAMAAVEMWTRLCRNKFLHEAGSQFWGSPQKCRPVAVVF